jgi:hypothetical protein
MVRNSVVLLGGGAFFSEKQEDRWAEFAGKLAARTTVLEGWLGQINVIDKVWHRCLGTNPIGHARDADGRPLLEVSTVLA